MIRKILVTAFMIGFFSVPAAAQSTYIELSYQSFKPFVHFQLNLGSSHDHYRDSYQSAYLKGYMDGVNDAYYNDYRFYELVHDIDIYEAGYRDGYRDRGLLIHLRGNSWYHQHRFVYDDYHSPYYSVQIWLDGLTFAFLQAPRHRLPDRWIHRVHPDVRRYRARMQKRNHYAHIEKRYKKHIKRLRKDARKTWSRYRKQNTRKNYRTGKVHRNSTIDKREAGKRVRMPRKNRYRSEPVQQKQRGRSVGNSPRQVQSNKRVIKRSRNNLTRDAKSNRTARLKHSSKRKQRKAVRSSSRKRSPRQHSVRKAQKRQSSRGSVKQDRKNSKKKSDGRKRSRGRGN